MYELWDGTSGSAMGAYEREDEVFAVIRATIEADGRDAVSTLALLRVNARGRATVVAEGDALVARALAATPAARPSGRAAAVPA